MIYRPSADIAPNCHVTYLKRLAQADRRQKDYFALYRVKSNTMTLTTPRLNCAAACLLVPRLRIEWPDE
jgi:hypothetical protein